MSIDKSYRPRKRKCVSLFSVENRQKPVASSSTTLQSLGAPTTAATSITTLNSEVSHINSIDDSEEILSASEFFEKTLRVDDIKDNEMREVVVDAASLTRVLLVKQHGRISAIGAKCPHYGAPLIDGVLGDGRIRCPWHGACFNIESGDIEDFPGVNGLSHHECRVEHGTATIRVRKSDLVASEKLRKTRKKQQQQITTSEGSRRGSGMYVIIGGGPAALTCAETLRMNNFNGRILMICKENHLPYDRMSLSKTMSTPSEQLELRTRPFFDRNGIELFLDTEALALDTLNKEISLSTGPKLIYDKLFLATGSRAKTMSHIVGHQLSNIFTLRSMDDAHRIDETVKASSRVIVIGSSFIALETAAYCCEKGASVVVMGRSSVPLVDMFGEAIGRRIMKLFIEKNVEFVMNANIGSFVSINQENQFSGVKLENGELIRGDVCIVGIGSQLNTDFLHDSELAINADGSLDTDAYLLTSAEDVWAGGDIANAPILGNRNTLATVGHFATAQYHGKVAALNMLGHPKRLQTVPYFSTEFFGKTFTYTGFGRVHEIFVEGDLEQLNFVGFYFDEEGFIVAMASCQPDKSVAEFAEKLHEGRRYHKSQIEWVDAVEDEQEIEMENKNEK